MLTRLRLSNDDRAKVRQCLMDAVFPRPFEETVVIERACLIAHGLPATIREAFQGFKVHEQAAALLVTHNPVGCDDIGPTPLGHWHRGEKRPLNIGQVLHGLYATLLGEPFGFATQQDGRIFNDLVSSPEAPANASSGGGQIGLHTEDISDTQPFMPDYLGFMCLRNEQSAVTTLSCLPVEEIPLGIRRTLFTRTVPYVNGTHRTVLFGDFLRPYLRYSQFNRCECDRDMFEALQWVACALERNVTRVTLQQGDCLYINNCLAVHGRDPFRVEYGEHGRWLSRLFILRDIRRIREFTISPESRICDVRRAARASAVA